MSRFDKQKTGGDPSRTGQLRAQIQEDAREEVQVKGHSMQKGDIFKFVGLIAFLLLSGLIVVLLWPYMHEVFEPGGIDRVINDVRSAGPLGVFILLGMQLLQIVVAFIPGEVVQVAAGMIYGPWWGAVVILVGCVISSAIIFELVHRLGAPFVQSMVSSKHLDKFRKFEETGKLNFIVFILFLIPAMPKDVFTYLVPLTSMPRRTFVVITNIARIPGVVVSTYAASSLAKGDYTESAIIFAVLAVISITAILCRERIMRKLGKDTRVEETE